MSVLYKIKDLANEKGVSLSELERTIGISNGSISKWEKSSPKADTLQKVANYFGVSVDYLLGSTNNRYYGLSEERKEMTVEQALKSVMSYDGKPMTDNDREILKGIIEAYMDKKKV